MKDGKTILVKKSFCVLNQSAQTYILTICEHYTVSSLVLYGKNKPQHKESIIAY